MTLFRQIALLVSAVYLLLLAVIAWTDFRESSRFMQGQMQTTATDLATTLGVTITNAVAKDDLAGVDTLFNAVFDSGYYTRIALISTGGEVLRAKEREVASPGVPGWFIAAVPLGTATGESQVMKGWQPYATLSVTLHPGYVYARLYETLQSALAWFALVAAGGLVGLWVLLHWLMKPLQKICQQAEAIHDNRFIQQQPLPRTRELYQVAAAMNRMVAKVQDVFDEQAATLKRNHELLYRDALTGLDNRRSFLLGLEARLDDEATRGGAVVLVRLHGLAESNQRYGYEQTDRIIIGLAKLLESQCVDASSGRCARVNASEFAVCLASSPEGAVAEIEVVFEAFRALAPVAEVGPAVWPSAGCAPIERGLSAGDVMALADTALAQAQAQGPWQVHVAESTTDELPRSKGQWRAWLSAALSEQRFFLAAQPVFAPVSTLCHRELFVRLRDSRGELVPAGRFLPMAASLGFGFAVDREVFRLALAACEAGSDGPVALNLSTSVLADADALAEFDEIVQRFVQSAPGRLSVEVGHSGLLEHVEAARHVADLLRRHGLSFGIDHFDPGADLHPLQSVRPAYIKVDARRLLDMASAGPGSMQALRTLAGSLDIRIFAAGVDSAELHERVIALGIDGAQGNYYQATEIWP